MTDTPLPMPDEIWARHDTHEGVWQSKADGYAGETKYTRADQPPTDALTTKNPDGCMEALEKIARASFNGNGEWEWQEADYTNAPPNEVARAALAKRETRGDE